MLHAKIFLFFLIPLFLAVSLTYAAGIELPVGGWRSNRCKDPDFLQRVSYPASSVNVNENACEDNLIRGRFPTFTSSPGDSPALSEGDGGVPDAEATLEDMAMRGDGPTLSGDLPATLVVNGSFMPLAMTGDSFERPYSFGTGSNSVEVRRQGVSLKRQYYEMNTTMTRPDLRIILSWDTDGTDLDLHVVTPDGGHCWYGLRALKNGGALDMDVTTGYGPEIFSMASPVDGLYGVYVNYYGSGDDQMTIIKVDVILHESTIDEKRMTRIIPLSREGDLVNVATFMY